MSVIFMPAATTLTPEQAVSSSQHEAPRLEKVIIVGVYDDGDLFIRSSRMTCAEALWLVEKARYYTLNC